MLSTRFLQLPDREIKVPAYKGYNEKTADILIDETTGTLSVSGNPATATSYYRTGAQIDASEETKIYIAAKTSSGDYAKSIFYLLGWFLLARGYGTTGKFIVADHPRSLGSASGDKASAKVGYRSYARILMTVSGSVIQGDFATTKQGALTNFLNCASLPKTGSYSFSLESVQNYCALSIIYLKETYIMQGSQLLWRWK